MSTRCTVSVRKRPLLRIMKKTQWIAGVDEAGRGPLAGPVAVAVALVPHDFDWTLIAGVGDSKKVTPRNREVIFRRAKELRKVGSLDFHVALVSQNVIDRITITQAVRRGIDICFKKLNPHPAHTEVKLDGLLKAPAQFLIQETIVKGDAKECVIGLASILAKVTRDAYMVRCARTFPEYYFEVHKGYGTKEHCELIQTYGLSRMHRRTFCKRFL